MKWSKLGGWTWVGIVMFAIFLTLFIGQPLARLLDGEVLQVGLFVLGMLLAGITILAHGWNKPSRNAEVIWVLGLFTVYILFFLRMSLAERSHMIEYSVLAVFIHRALRERPDGKYNHLVLAFMAFLFSFLIGVLDECIQLFLPHRVFDWEDILFNGIVSACAIVASLLLTGIRSRFS